MQQAGGNSSSRSGGNPKTNTVNPSGTQGAKSGGLLEALFGPPLSPQEAAARKRRAAKDRQALISFAAPIAAAAILIGIAAYFVVGPKIAAGVPLGILSIALSYRYPEKALWFFMFYMPFSGTVTYWLAGGSAIFQLAKDAFYVPALIGIILQARQRKETLWEPGSIIPAIMMMVVLCGLSLLIVSLPSQFLPTCTKLLEQLKQSCKDGIPFAQGLLGMKVFIGYVPLIFCTRYLLKTRRELLFLSRSHVLLAIVCCGLCLLQYLMLLTGRCQGTDHLSGDSLFKATLEAKCLVGGSLVYSPSQGVIRLPGTFVAPWQWGWFLIGNAYLTFAGAFSDPNPMWRIMGLVSMASVMMGAVISGQRIALALVPVSFAVLVVLTGQFTNLKRFVPIAAGIALMGMLGMALYPEIVQERIDSFMGRWEASPADQMIAHQFSFVWAGIQDRPLGRGLGSATNSARLFGETTLIETWFPKVMYEVGLIGLIVFLLFVTALTFITFRAYRLTKDKNLRSFAACYWVFVLVISYQTYFYPLDVDPVAVYYWVFIGAILRIPELDRQEQEPDPSGPPPAPPPPRFAPVRSRPKEV